MIDPSYKESEGLISREEEKEGEREKHSEREKKNKKTKGQT